jgi:antitoxin ParD1/3/4
MVSVSKRTFSLPTKLAGYVDAKIRSGAYASGSEVIRAGLRALQERDAVFERWLHDEVVPIYDATKADPSSRIPAKAAFAEARARYSKRRKARL